MHMGYYGSCYGSREWLKPRLDHTFIKMVVGQFTSYLLRDADHSGRYGELLMTQGHGRGFRPFTALHFGSPN